MAHFVVGKVWIVHIAFPGAHSLASLSSHQLPSDSRHPLKRIPVVVADPDDHPFAAPIHERHSRSKPKYVETEARSDLTELFFSQWQNGPNTDWRQLYSVDHLKNN